jgi:tetratricopeptide (TPR) repeat protein
MRKAVPYDLLQCQTCGHVLEQQDWMPPLLPLSPDRCLNCGNRRGGNGRCTGCGLSYEEDIQVHDELRFMVDPDLDLMDAARKASRMGRRLIALKLATAVAQLDEGENADIARALRVWLLSAIGDAQAAVSDAKAWVESHPDPPAMAWASYGQQLQHGGFQGPAADAYHRALAKDPYQHLLRARRAQLLFHLSRDGQALDETMKVFDNAGEDENAIQIAIEVAGLLCDKFEVSNRDEEIQRVLERGRPYADRSPLLLAHRARLAAMRGEGTKAKRDLKRARRLDPELEIYERVERAIRPERGSWWRW